MKITIGADPELFLENEKDFVSAIDRVGGSKQQPMPLGRDGFFVQEDNVAVEFNIPPAETMEQFVESIEWSIKALAETVKPQLLSLSKRASAFFPASELADPRAMMFGCDPDRNAWTGKFNPRPQASSKYLRSCGGHVHVGHDSKIPTPIFVKSMDLHLGVPSVLMDSDQTRRQLYGKAGAFRPTSYGFEYRTLSNFWLHSQATIKWVYEQTVRAMNFVETLTSDVFSDTSLSHEIVEAINTPNPELALRMCERYKLVTP